MDWGTQQDGRDGAAWGFLVFPAFAAFALAFSAGWLVAMSEARLGLWPPVVAGVIVVAAFGRPRSTTMSKPARTKSVPGITVHREPGEGVIPTIIWLEITDPDRPGLMRLTFAAEHVIVDAELPGHPPRVEIPLDSRAGIAATRLRMLFLSGRSAGSHTRSLARETLDLFALST